MFLFDIFPKVISWSLKH